MERTARRLLLACAAASVTACSLLIDSSDLVGGGARPSDAGGDCASDDVCAVVAPADGSIDASGDALGEAGCGEPGLVARWMLDEDAGLVARDCVQGLSGSLNQVTWAPGHLGGGASFRGNGWISLGTPKELQFSATEMTAAVWVRATSFPALLDSGSNPVYVVGKTSNLSASGWRIAIEADHTVTFGVSTGSAVTFATGNAISADTWTHLAAVYRPGASIEVYVNGALKQSVSAGVPAAIIDSDAEARIGARGDGVALLNGVVDDVRFYTRALSAVEIAALQK